MSSRIRDSVNRIWFNLFPDLSDPKDEFTAVQKYDVVDYYGDLEVMNENEETEKRTKTNLFQRMYSSIRSDIYVAILLLVLLGSSTSIVSAFIDWSIDNLQETRNMLSSLTPYFLLNYFLYMAYSVFFAVLAVACVENISTGSRFEIC
jgi:hypothetical protein